jgi:sec-independent protein translocase protein TatA
MFGNIGWGEIIILMVIILLLFGARRIPEVMRSLGQGVREFKKSMNEVTSEIQKAPEEGKKPEEKKG